MRRGKPFYIELRPGERCTIGTVLNHTESRMRIIETNVKGKINTKHPAFRVLEGGLEKLGYEPEIFPNGKIKLIMPKNDHYGTVLREIAKTYFMALNSDAKYQAKLSNEASQ